MGGASHLTMELASRPGWMGLTTQDPTIGTGATMIRLGLDESGARWKQGWAGTPMIPAYKYPVLDRTDVGKCLDDGNRPSLQL